MLTCSVLRCPMFRCPFLVVEFWGVRSPIVFTVHRQYLVRIQGFMHEYVAHRKCSIHRKSHRHELSLLTIWRQCCRQCSLQNRAAFGISHFENGKNKRCAENFDLLFNILVSLCLNTGKCTIQMKWNYTEGTKTLKNYHAWFSPILFGSWISDTVCMQQRVNYFRMSLDWALENGD